MVLGKVFKAWYKIDKNSAYSLLLEKRNDKSQSLLFEAELIATLSAQETESVKHLYSAKSDAYGCLGVLKLAVGDSSHLFYLVLVNSCVSVGKIDKSEIFRITDTTFISLRNNTADNEKIYEIRRILNSGTFYFSSSSQENDNPFDLTLSVQRQLRTNQTDNRFFWNRAFHSHFLRFGVNTDRWLIKVICGCISISTVYVGHQQARACLISRLSSERAGTRFNVRGLDDNGNVANFVETEQNIFLESKVSSYVILRGSVPLFWEQPGINFGSHKVKISRGNEVSQPSYNRHVAMLRRRYGKCVFINLMGSKEGEAMLSTLFRAHHQSSPFFKDVAYIEFDYHAQCPRGKQENLSKILGAEIKSYMSDFGFFCSGTNVVVNSQTGCFRINCVDCLDRTNSVKTFICLEMLKHQLAALMLSDRSTILSRFEETFKRMWVTNGDQISQIYAGTGALEGKSKIKDSTLSVKRSIQNNILDSSKQEGFDVLLTGKTLNNEYSDRARALLPPEYLNLSNNILISLCDRYLEYTNPVTIKVVVGSWNVNGGKHFNTLARKTEPLSDWLLDYKKKQNEINIMNLSLNNSLDELSELNAIPDIFAIGFEEIVDLNASNIMAASTTNQREWLKELQVTISRDNSYVLVSKVQLVGVCLFVFVRPCHAPFIREVAVDQVKTGLGGATGNKGGVAIRMQLYNSSLCFVCAHFAAGQSQYQDRNADYAEITRKINFPFNRSLNSHDYVFWCGDFNYRIDLENDQVKEHIKNENWQSLLSFDQLLVQQSKGKVFRNYIEGKINFAPTYKYDIDSADYDTSEKCRVPAYTDRILFKKKYPTRLGEDPLSLNYGKILFYGRCELKTSDHRPVISEYNIEILKVNKEKREELFRSVIESLGPQDSSVIVKHKLGIIGFDDSLVTHILKVLADEGGEIILARYSENYLTITFRESISALKVVRNCSNKLLDENISIELKSPNWVDLIDNEINLSINNTIPLQEQSEEVVDDLELLSTNFKAGYDSSISCIEYEMDIFSSAPSQVNPSPEIMSINRTNELLDRPLQIPIRQFPTRPPPFSSPTVDSKSSSYLPPPKTPFLNTQQSNSVKSKLIPIRPAPLPPSQQIKEEQRTTFETNPNFSLPPPDIPAPSLPDDYEDGVENNYFEFESQLPPPLPPPRIDSFENNQENEEPSSLWQTLPPAPPLPPLDNLDNPPPIPKRPKPIIEVGNFNLNNSKPPPIPARSKLNTNQSSFRKGL